MKKIKSVFALLISLSFFLSFFSVQTLSGQEELDNAQLEQEVYQLLTHSEALFEHRDLEGLVDRFIPDGSIKLRGNALVQGHEALNAFYANTIQLEDFKLELQPVSVSISKAGDMAWLMAGFSVSFNSPGGPFADQGISLMVLHRVNGVWKIAAENLSSGPSS